jgi:hypothetical protein
MLAYCVVFLFFSFFFRLVYPTLSVSLDCPFCIAASVFSIAYLNPCHLRHYIFIPQFICIVLGVICCMARLIRTLLHYLYGNRVSMSSIFVTKVVILIQR